MNLAGWGAGLALLLLAGCADVPQAGLLGRAQPLAQAGGTEQERDQAFLQHRVALNMEGAEVGHVHLDRAGLAAYFQASGAADLAEEAGRPAQTWTARGPGPWTCWSPLAEEDDVGFPVVHFWRRDLDNVKDSPDHDLAAVAAEFNQRLAKRLGIALNEAWMEPTPLFRVPLPAARVAVAPNAALEDWAADYRLRFDAVRAYNGFWRRDRAIGSYHWTGGGRLLPEADVADYMVDQGQPALAWPYRRGKLLRFLSWPMIYLGALILGAGLGDLVDPSSRQSAATAIGVGAAIAGSGCLSFSFGLSDCSGAVDGFNQALLPAVQARAKALGQGVP
jgi:hypothetical protein